MLNYTKIYQEMISSPKIAQWEQQYQEIKNKINMLPSNEELLNKVTKEVNNNPDCLICEEFLGEKLGWELIEHTPQEVIASQLRYEKEQRNMKQYTLEQQLKKMLYSSPFFKYIEAEEREDDGDIYYYYRPKESSLF